MTKKQTYIALGAALVVLLGVIGYLGMGSSEPEVNAGPPVLQENPSLSGTLTTEADRFFRVTDDGEGDLLNYSPKAPSNFLIFTTPSNFSGVTFEELAEELIVDDGLSGYVLGTYLPSQGGWNLLPSKNYLGAQTIDSSDTVEACRTYFLIKIADDHNTDNGFSAANGWGSVQRSQIAFNQSYFDIVNSGTSGCGIDQKGLTPNAWNMTTTDASAADELLGSFSAFDDVFAIWDTTVINQIDRSVDPAQTRNANQRLFVDSNNTSFNELVEYFAGDIPSAGVVDHDDNYDGGKQDLWVYVGGLVSGNSGGGNTGGSTGGNTGSGTGGTPTNNPPELNEINRTINLDERLKQVRETAISSGRIDAIVLFLQEKLELPSENLFAVADADNDTLNIVNTQVNDFEVELNNDEIRAIDTSLLNSGLLLDQNGQREFGLDVEIEDGTDTTATTATITYEWSNRCVAVENAYEEHLLRSLEKMVYDEYQVNGNDFGAAIATVANDIENLIQTQSFGSTDPNLTEQDIRDEVAKYWETLNNRMSALTFDSQYLQNPPYLPAQCGGGFASCVDTVMCTFLVDSVSDYMYGFGILLESVAFPKQAVVQQQSVAAPAATVVQQPTTVSQSQIMTPEDRFLSIEQSSLAGSGAQVAVPSGLSTQKVVVNTNLSTLTETCTQKQLTEQDVQLVTKDTKVPSTLVAATQEGYKLYAMIELGLCDQEWSISFLDGTGQANQEQLSPDKFYEIDPSRLFMRNGEKLSQNTGSLEAYVYMDGNGMMGVYISLVEEGDVRIDIVEKFGVPELVISEGLFIYEDVAKKGLVKS